MKKTSQWPQLKSQKSSILSYKLMRRKTMFKNLQPTSSKKMPETLSALTKRLQPQSYLPTWDSNVSDHKPAMLLPSTTSSKRTSHTM